MVPSIFRNKRPVANEHVALVRVVAVGLTLALLTLSAPIVWSAVSAGVGLAALATLAAAGALVFQTLPLAMQVLENRLLRLRKAAAAANPIEQLQNDCLRREQRLTAFRNALATIGGQIESMAQMIEERRHVDPSHVLDRQARALQKMVRFHAGNVKRLDEAQAALEAFRHQVRQKMFEWEFAQSGEVVMAALNPSELNDLMQDLLTDVALQSVQKRFNQVFAELDLEMRAVDAPTRNLLDMSSLERLGMLATPRRSRERRIS
jgi:phage shock protein A